MVKQVMVKCITASRPYAIAAPPAADNELSRYRREGWQAGHRRGMEIGTRILKERRAELEKASP